MLKKDSASVQSVSRSSFLVWDAAVKPSKVRRQIAWEAALLMHQQPTLRHSDARRRVAERLCPEGLRPYDLPSDEEVASQLRALKKQHAGTDEQRRFERYAELLHPLAQVKQSPEYHPEGDALYHSLQVFALANERLPYDEEFLTAALLHDVGKAIDRRNHVAAAVAALEGLVTPRTAWLIENLPLALNLGTGSLGARAKRRLESAPDYEELIMLAECDRAGRVRGARVGDLEDAIHHLQDLHRLHDE